MRLEDLGAKDGMRLEADLYQAKSFARNPDQLRTFTEYP
jgi:hypothetical protein